MANRISLERLQAALVKHKIGLTDPEGYRLADRLIEWCHQNNQGSAYGEASVLNVTHLGDALYKAWSTETARAYFAAKIRPPDEADEDEPSVWSNVKSPAFGLASYALLSQSFMLAREVQQGQDGRQLYLIEDPGLRQLVAAPSKPGDLRVLVMNRVLPTLDSEGVGANDKLIDLMTLQFRARAPLWPEPEMLGQPDADDWCLHRATILPNAAMVFPLIMQFFERLNDPEAVAAYIWGIYSGRNLGRQMLYLWGLGQDGKSEFITLMIEALFGSRISAAFHANKISADSKFASSLFRGKRLVVAADNNNPYLFQSTLLKSLSGSDPLVVEVKFESPVTMRFNCRVIAAGNAQLWMLRALHSTSRLIPITVAPLGKSNAQIDPHYTAKCIAELPGFLAWAERCYAERCPYGNDYAIEVNDAVRKSVELRIAVCESANTSIFNQFFVVDPKGEVSSATYAEAVKEARLEKFAIDEFRQWIVAKYGASLQLAVDGDWLLAGIRKRTGADHYRPGNNRRDRDPHSNVHPMPFPDNVVHHRFEEAE